MYKTEQKRHVGLILNYQCNAACRHCYLACSPDFNNDYMTAAAAERICTALYAKGIRSLHIGGGEPFLNFGRLIDVITAVRKSGLSIEYVETNAFWAKDDDEAIKRLQKLKDAGADNLLISTDPFHIEYVPMSMPLRLAEICDQIGFKYFLWQEKYRDLLSHLDLNKTHSRDELETTYSKTYIKDAVLNQGFNHGGRAMNMYQEALPMMPLDDVLSSVHPCKNLLNTRSIHVDLYERFGLSCTGMALPLSEALSGMAAGKYKVFEILASQGAGELLIYARSAGFVPKNEYVSYCALCFDIRCFLSTLGIHDELDARHYEQALLWY